MHYRKLRYVSLLTLFCLSLGAAPSRALSKSATVPQTPADFITPQELQAKLATGEPVTIIDVRASGDIANSESKIKGAVHVKLRRLKSRLAMPPLSSVPRSSLVVLYCACPNDEASIRGARILAEAGFKRVQALKGGWVAWKKSQGPVEAKPRG